MSANANSFICLVPTEKMVQCCDSVTKYAHLKCLINFCCQVGVIIVWCHHCMVSSLYGVVIVWCRHCMVSSLYGVVIVWCRHCMVSSLYGVVIVWCRHCMVSSSLCRLAALDCHFTRCGVILCHCVMMV